MDEKDTRHTKDTMSTNDTRDTNGAPGSPGKRAGSGIPQGHVSLFPLVRDQAGASGSLYTDSPSARIRLTEMLDADGWLGTEPVYRGRDVFLPAPAASRLRDEVLPLWLRAFGRTTGEKARLLLDHYGGPLPRTCTAIRSFLDGNGLWEREAALQAADHLIWHCLSRSPGCQDTAPDYGEDDLLDLALSARPFLGRTAFGLLGELMRSVMERPSAWQYSFVTPDYVSLDTDAYPLETFARLAFRVFNPVSIEEHSLVEKAQEDRAFAALWIFIALHFVCALRSTDIRRLPAPVMPAAGAGGKTEDERRARTCALWEEQISLLGLTPNKTSRHGNVPSIKVFIPDVLRPLFGLFLSLALKGHETGTPFLDCDPSVSRLRAFFGEDFVRETGGRAFSTRKANKSFLQGLEALSSKTGGPADGYLLARIARSHKGTPYEFSCAATDHYLRDASFHGLTARAALGQMFERGVFGFLPVLLAESLDRRAFRSLTPSGQSRLLKELGLKPWQLEAVCRSCIPALDRAEAAVREVLRAGAGNEGALAGALKALSDRPPGSPEGAAFCLLSASGIPCASPGRGSCMGCAFEICAKAFLRCLMDAYVLITRRAQRAAGEEKARLTAIRTEGVAPVLARFIKTWPCLCSAEDTDVMEAIVKEGLDALPGKDRATEPRQKGASDE